MSVELPFAPVDSVIRRNAGGLRVSAEAAEELAEWIQRRGAILAERATHRADTEGRKTLMPADFGVSEVIDPDALELPIAPVDRIARLDIEERYRVSMDARIALAQLLEADADDIAEAATTLARHAGRRTVKAEDIRTYIQLVE